MCQVRIKPVTLPKQIRYPPFTMIMSAYTSITHDPAQRRLQRLQPLRQRLNVRQHVAMAPVLLRLGAGTPKLLRLDDAGGQRLLRVCIRRLPLAINTLPHRSGCGRPSRPVLPMSRTSTAQNQAQDQLQWLYVSRENSQSPAGRGSTSLILCSPWSCSLGTLPVQARVVRILGKGRLGLKVQHEPGDYSFVARIFMHSDNAHAVPQSAQIAEWYLHEDFLLGPEPAADGDLKRWLCPHLIPENSVRCKVQG